MAVTSHPSNESELQIYRVLQRANLLSYYDTFIAQGKQNVLISFAKWLSRGGVEIDRTS